jgi:hypothetical protein
MSGRNNARDETPASQECSSEPAIDQNANCRRGMPEVISYQKFSNISSVRLQQAALYLQTSRHIYFSFIFIIKFRSVFGFQITSIP